MAAYLSLENQTSLKHISSFLVELPRRDGGGGLVQNLATPHMLVGFSWKLEAICSIFSSSVVGDSSPSEAIILPGELLVQKCQEATWLHYLQNGQYLRKASSILQAFYIHSNDRVKTLDLIPVCLLRKGD